jgi:hypothetical protein
MWADAYFRAIKLRHLAKRLDPDGPTRKSKQKGLWRVLV